MQSRLFIHLQFLMWQVYSARYKLLPSVDVIIFQDRKILTENRIPFYNQLRWKRFQKYASRNRSKISWMLQAWMHNFAFKEFHFGCHIYKITVSKFKLNKCIIQINEFCKTVEATKYNKIGALQFWKKHTVKIICVFRKYWMLASYY